MSLIRRFSVLGLVSAAALAAACSDRTPLAPAAGDRAVAVSGSADLLGITLTDVGGVVRKAPLKADVVASKLISNKAGASIAVAGTGLTVTIPAGALPRDTMTITVTALGGNAVAYDFEPAGTKFVAPLKLTQDAKYLSLLGTLMPTSMQAAYFADRSQVDASTGNASVNELLPTLVDIVGSKVSFNVSHFSGYMVSGGRR